MLKGKDGRAVGYLPFRQSEQMPEPVNENFPATHSSQSEIDVPEVGLEKPASQL